MRSPDRRPTPSRSCQVRRRIGRRLPRRPALRHVGRSSSGRKWSSTSAHGSGRSRSRRRFRRQRPRRPPGRARRAPIKAALLDQRTHRGASKTSTWTRRCGVHGFIRREARSLDTRRGVQALTAASGARSSTAFARQGSTLRDYALPTAAQGRCRTSSRSTAAPASRATAAARRSRRSGSPAAARGTARPASRRRSTPRAARRAGRHRRGGEARSSRRSGGRRSGSAAPSSCPSGRAAFRPEVQGHRRC